LLDIGKQNKYKLFLRWLVDEAGLKPSSLGRAIGLISGKPIRKNNMFMKNYIRLTQVYSAQYIQWCTDNGYEVENELLDYLEKLYGGEHER